MHVPAKQVLREALLAARRRLTAKERAALSGRIADRVLALDAFSRARTVALYLPMGAEVDTSAIGAAADAAGKRVVYPRIDEQRRPLSFAACPAGELVPGGYRSREPPAGAPGVALDEIDLVVVPGVAFDSRCRRLGRGQGYYDATLAALPAATARIGLAYDLQLVEEVPEEPHDAPLDAVVTDTRIVFRLPDRQHAPDTSH